MLRSSARRPLLTFCALLVLTFTSASLAPAQTIEVRNGGSIEVANDGVWDLKGSMLDLGPAGTSASIKETSGGRFAGGTLEATRDVGTPSPATGVAGLGIQIEAGKDLGATTVTRGHAVQTGNGNSSIERYYEISPGQNNSGLSAEITFPYNDDELNGLSESNLELFKSTDGGQTWSEEGQDGRDTNANTVTLSGVQSFSRWTLGSVQNPLPVEMAAFEAQAQKKQVVLQWQTASETNNAGFEVEHEGPAQTATWSKIGFVESKAEGGTTTEAKRYRFAVEDLPVGTHRFRLKQVDLSGEATTTDPVTATVRMQEALRLTPPAPNPVRGTATLRFGAKTAGKVTVVLYDMLGRRMKTLFEGRSEAGRMQTVRLQATELPAGTYFLRLQADGQMKTRRLTVVR